MRYWDSSALLPLLVNEPQSEEMRSLAGDPGPMVVWWGSPVECLSALTRRSRMGLTRSELARAEALLTGFRDEWSEVPPVDPVRATAEVLLRRHPLRAADALQLAAALVATDFKPQEHDFITLDTRLGVAAHGEGFRVLPPLPDDA
ncbi:MAG: type II toxin-antitoxin system VapC family toxin [Gemmatimonadales bacterium]|nr:type II toxin-antitoxin system VapC family toxin [Gemmatimonadales bacterium]